MDKEKYELYRKNVKDILNISKDYIGNEKYLEAYEYLKYGEHALSLDLLLNFINELDYVPYNLGILIKETLEKFPTDGEILGKDVVESFFKKLENSKIVF